MPGQLVPEFGIWTGHARSDGSRDGSKAMIEQWNSKQWKIKLLKCEAYTERDRKGRTYIFQTSQIATIVNKEKNEFKVLTREARTEQERAVHPRQPINMSNKWTDKSFTEFLNNKLGTNYKTGE